MDPGGRGVKISVHQGGGARRCSIYLGVVRGVVDPPIVNHVYNMRNLGATSCTVLPAEKLLGDAQHFCLDCDRGAVWIATRNELCSIENNNVC